MSTLLVAQIEGLASGIGHRVIVPGGEPELVGVLHPGVRAAFLADDRSDVRAGDDIDPRRRRALTRLEGNDVFTPVGRETAQAVAENAFARRQRMGRFCGRLRTYGLGA